MDIKEKLMFINNNCELLDSHDLKEVENLYRKTRRSFNMSMKISENVKLEPIYSRLNQLSDDSDSDRERKLVSMLIELKYGNKMLDTRIDDIIYCIESDLKKKKILYDDLSDLLKNLKDI